jgi:hypothetical protein
MSSTKSSAGGDAIDGRKTLAAKRSKKPQKIKMGIGLGELCHHSLGME